MPELDDPVLRARLKARIKHEAARPHPFASGRPLMVLLVLALVASGVLLMAPGRTSAGFSLTRLLHRGIVSWVPSHPIGPVLQESQLPGRPATDATATPVEQPLVFRAIVPPTLPGGFVLSQPAATRPDLLQLTFQGPDHLVVALTEVPSTNTKASLPASAQLQIIAGTEILWQGDPSTQRVYHAVWIRQGVLFDIQVLAAPGSGLPPDVMQQAIERVIVLQDAVKG